MFAQTAEIITLLYESTLHPLHPEAPALNPTGGVKVKPPLGGLVFRKDPTRPGGGVFVARDTRTSEDLKHLPAGTVITEEAPEDGAATQQQQQQQQRGHQQHSRQQQQQQSQQQQHEQHHPQVQPLAAPTMVNYAPLVGSNYPNVNPAMNNGPAQVLPPGLGGGGGAGSGNGGANAHAGAGIPPGYVQVINLLDQANGANALEQLALAEAGFLDGMPQTIFDWNSWDSFFARMNQAQHSAQQQQQQPAASVSGSGAAGPYQHPPYSAAPPSGPL